MDSEDKSVLERYGQRVGYNEEDMAHLGDKDPRTRHIRMLSQAARNYSIQAEVIESRHCNSGHRVGDTFVLDADGNFITKLCPKRMCVYLISQLVVPVALINERLSEGLDPNQFHFMRNVRCPDVGVECAGYGSVMLRVGVVPRV